MRNELEEMEQIENYLLNKMTEAEKKSFEQQMESDPQLKNRIANQYLLVSGMKRLAVKESIQASEKKYFLRKALTKIGLGVAGLIIAAFLALQFNNGSRIEKKPFINPPFKGVNIPYTDYIVHPADSTNITSPSGSIIHVPKNAFLDENGKPISHDIRLRYREFRDPAEIFIAGIPMIYDSAGNHYDFESAGMFEILGFDGDKPAFIDPAKPITVELASLSDGDSFNQYFLDTVAREWKYISTDEPEERFYGMAAAKRPVLVPVISNPSKYTISIETDSVEFPELYVY